MSDRQTPESPMDRARRSILKFRASAIGMPLPSRVLMTEHELREIAGEIQIIGITHPQVGPRFVQAMTAAQFREHVVNAAAKGELYLWGVRVVVDDENPEIRCEGASRYPPQTRLDALIDRHASIVRPDGTVGGISRDPLPFWKNCDGAARGAEECRADQHAGVANSVQAAQGCRVAAGAEDGADLCTLGTADSPSHPLCVGGPLHGLRRPADANVWLQRTRGGPDGQGLERHVYDMRIAFRGGQRVRWWQWRMKPRWTSAGIKGPRQ